MASNATRLFYGKVAMYRFYKVVIFVSLSLVCGRSFSSWKHFMFSASGRLLSSISPTLSPSNLRNPDVVHEVQSVSSTVGLSDVGPFIVEVMEKEEWWSEKKWWGKNVSQLVSWDSKR
eukprot:TRINITY_DN1744_c0_g1_i3.p1 TRINITY_DN1744_c0_g1~~TRINITY_DN1744_c0_g1_i3.p1  ORF type:complete len:118 (-),score=3.82 TRINITY_DN1744_c0_g1_i3:116-469(-)